MTRETLSSWRRRCVDAEKRAELAERSLKRTRGALKRTEASFAAVLDDHETAKAAAIAYHRILVRRAIRDLGPGASRKEADELLQRWLVDDRKRVTAARPPTLTIIAGGSSAEILRRLGFDPSGEATE